MSHITSKTWSLRKGLETEIRETVENLTYWTRQKVTASRPGDKADAGARVLLWDATLKAKCEKLAAFNSIHC